MEIKKIKLKDLKVEDLYVLSFPVRPEIYNELECKFPQLPFIIVNRENSVIYGIDSYYFFKSNSFKEVSALEMDLSKKDALFLNYNLKEKFYGINPFEKFVFLKKILNYSERNEILRRTNIDLDINKELLEKLDLITSDEFKDVLINNKITFKSLIRLCDFKKEDRKNIKALFNRVSFTHSYQIKILEMLEEILFRDKSSIKDIWEKLQIYKYLNFEKPQKKIVEEMFKFCYPVYTEKEREWQGEIKKLKLGKNMKISHYPFFEKRQIELKIFFQNIDEIKKMQKNY